MRSGAHNQLGLLGESLAAEFLLKKGYSLLKKNLVFKLGEIDLLMRDSEEIVLVEVKTLKRSEIFDPLQKIDFAKRKKLRILAGIIESQYPERNIRIDAVTVYWNHLGEGVVDHFENIC